MKSRFTLGSGLLYLLSGCSENRFYSAVEEESQEASPESGMCDESGWYVVPEETTRPTCIGIRNEFQYDPQTEKYCVVLSFDACENNAYLTMNEILWSRLYDRTQEILLVEGANLGMSKSRCGLPELLPREEYKHCVQQDFVPEGYNPQEIGALLALYILTPQERETVTNYEHDLEQFEEIKLVGQFWCETADACTGYLNHP